jgi:hypothetical protein
LCAAGLRIESDHGFLLDNRDFLFAKNIEYQSYNNDGDADGDSAVAENRDASRLPNGELDASIRRRSPVSPCRSAAVTAPPASKARLGVGGASLIGVVGGVVGGVLRTVTRAGDRVSRRCGCCFIARASSALPTERAAAGGGGGTRGGAGIDRRDGNIVRSGA